MVTLVASNYESGWWQFGCVGGIFGCILLLILLIYTIVNYLKIFLSKNYKNELQEYQQSNKTIYTLTIIYFFTGLIASMIYTLTRSNIITRTNASNFTENQCQFGYISSILLFAINRIFLYILIIKRIKISFKSTNYEYNPMLFLCLYWIMSIITTLKLILWITSSQSTDSIWILITNSMETLIFCQNKEINPNENVTTNGLEICLMIIEIAFKFYLLYLFWNGLFKLYKTLANDVIAGNIDDEKEEEKQGEEKPNKVTGIKVDSLQHKKLKFLCELIKKQTILLFFGVSSTFIYYMFAAISTVEGKTLLTWDCLINSICIWLMFFYAEKYWKCCTKFGCCCCCYITQNLDEYLSQAM